MARRWRGVLVRENEQTGDGRVIAPGALEWAELPLPLAFLVDGDQHVMPSTAPVIGNIDRIERQGDDVWGWGTIDTTISDDGADLVARLEAGTAPGGARWPLSIDADDWVVEIIATEPDGEEMPLLLIASGRGPLRDLGALRAAAGDPDPGDGQPVLFENSSGAIIERATHLRIRGVTACSVAAFAAAYLELDPEAEVEPVPESEPGEQPAPIPDAVVAAADLVSPPAEWFAEPEPEDGDDRLVEQPDGTRAVPLTITDDGQVYGHVAAWGACHVGFLDACVSPPESASGYALYNLGAVHASGGASGGTIYATGPLVVNCDHAPGYASAVEARDHYAHAGMAWADVHMTAGAFGPWFAGALRPGVTPEQVRVLRALSPSGDWRPDGRGGLELVAVLAVNTPGFPIAREALAASGLNPVDARDAPAVGLTASGAVGSIVAAGIVYRCADCARRRSLRAAGPQETALVAAAADIGRRLDRLERMMAVGFRAEMQAEAQALAARIRNR